MQNYLQKHSQKALQKIAICGKGGVGKTTLTALLGTTFAKTHKVILVDADSSPNLALSFGIPLEKREKITPLAQMIDLIKERTFGEEKNSSPFYIMNPKVDDIVEKYGIKIYENLTLLVLGGITKPKGCFCPENAFLKTLVKHLIVDRNELLIFDFSAGVEYLSRKTAENMDALIIVVKPDIKSLEVANNIKKLALQIGVSNIFALLNMVKGNEEVKNLQEKIFAIRLPLLGVINYEKNIEFSDSQGINWLKEFVENGNGKYSSLNEELNNIKSKLENLKLLCK